MKKVLLVFSLILLCVSISFSQFGIKGGLNLGTFGGDDKAINPAFFDGSLASLPSIEPKVRTAFVAGAFYNVSFIPIVSLQFEGLYAQKGAVYEIALPTGGSGKGTFKLDYIDIPVVARISPLPLPMLKPYVEAGVSYSILVGAKLKGESPGGSAETDIKDGMTKNDLSILVGVGVEVLILDVNARYVMGQTKIFKDGDAKVYNRSFMLTVGLKL